MTSKAHIIDLNRPQARSVIILVDVVLLSGGRKHMSGTYFSARSSQDQRVFLWPSHKF